MRDAKPCIGCGEVKPLDEYHRDRSKPDGRVSRCKTCVAEHHRRYCEANRDKVQERHRRYREANRDKRLESQRRYCEANRDKRLESHRRYREENRDKRLEYDRWYWEENREFCNRSAARRFKKLQDNSALTATRTGKPWTPAEDDILTADDGRNLFAKALLLGRTYTSCATRRNRLNHATT